jgi:hypothetical protein
MPDTLDPMRIRIFGRPWGAPVCEDAPRVEVPVGQKCLWCQDPIEEGDSGVVTFCIHADGTGTHEPSHRDCHIRQAVGSVGHQLGKCICFGGPGSYDDPPGLTYRQAAELAVALFYYRHDRQ